MEQKNDQMTQTSKFHFKIQGINQLGLLRISKSQKIEK